MIVQCLWFDPGWEFVWAKATDHACWSPMAKRAAWEIVEYDRTGANDRPCPDPSLRNDLHTDTEGDTFSNNGCTAQIDARRNLCEILDKAIVTDRTDRIEDDTSTDSRCSIHDGSGDGNCPPLKVSAR